MRIKISLSYKHDTDLLLLAYNPYFNLKQAILDALEAYATGNIITIPVPISNENLHFDLSNGYPKKIIVLDVYEKKNPGAYHFLSCINSSFRTMCVKSILRHCLSTPYISSFLNTSEGNNEFITNIPVKQPVVQQVNITHKNPTSSFDKANQSGNVTLIEQTNDSGSTADYTTINQQNKQTININDTATNQKNVLPNMIQDPDLSDPFDLFSDDNSFVENY